MKYKTRIMVAELVGMTRALAMIAECKMVAVAECAANAKQLADDVMVAMDDEAMGEMR